MRSTLFISLVYLSHSEVFALASKKIFPYILILFVFKYNFKCYSVSIHSTDTKMFARSDPPCLFWKPIQSSYSEEIVQIISRFSNKK
jgi:hypothetical protein